MHLAIDSRYWDSSLGSLFEDEIFIRQDVTIDSPAEKIMNAFWEKTFGEAGCYLPAELRWQKQD